MTTVKKGFTLIELVMVIIILGILAAITLPKFGNFKLNAITAQEDAIIAAMKIAIQAIHMSYVVAGYEDSWPVDCPFSLIVSPPRYTTYFTPPNKETWRHYNYTGANAWCVYCPHWNATGDYADSGGSKGRFYLYFYGQGPEAWGVKPGDFAKCKANFGPCL